MEHPLSFQEQIKNLRSSRHWSRESMAEKLGVETKTIERWEHGTSYPQPRQLKTISKTFNISIDIIDTKHLDERLKRQRKQVDDIPYIYEFFGREQEIAILEGWALSQECKLILVQGMGGIGKTTLISTMVEKLEANFDVIFWHSLQDAPPLEKVIYRYLQRASGQQQIELPQSIDDQLLLVSQYLRDYRCLLILDNLESILQANQRVGAYREGYEQYGRFLKHIAHTQHQSCLLLTSREQPRELAHIDGIKAPVRTLHLAGLEETASSKIMQDKGLLVTETTGKQLVNLYSGNPLALKIVSASIQDVFNGNIAAFLQTKGTVFGDINDLLEQQFQRLTTPEQEILYWLAIEREAVSLAALQHNLLHTHHNTTPFETLSSLRRRSMIETQAENTFTLQPVVMEYVLEQLIERATQDFMTETFHTWLHYALVKAQTQDYIRHIQIRLILAPIVQRLLMTLSKAEIELKVLRMLALQKERYPQKPVYAAGNALHLLLHLHSNLNNIDFSHLYIRQAYLQHIELPAVNFAHSHFADSVFTNAFGNILSVAFHPNDSLLATGTATGEIWIYQMPEGAPLLTSHQHKDGIWALTFSPDGRLLASSSDDQTIRLWKIQEHNTLLNYQILQDHTNRVRAVAFSPDSLMVASGSDDQEIRLWDSLSGACLDILQGHTGRIWSVAFSPDGQLLASGSTDQTIRIWHLPSKTCLHILQGHTDWIRSIAFSPDGQLLASGSNDHTIKIWQVQSGQCIQTIPGHTNHVWSVNFSPDGNTLASSSEDQKIRLWDTTSWSPIATLQGHQNGVRAITFNPTGQLLASGGDDQTCRLWRVSNQSSLKTLQGYTNRIWSIAFSADGSTLASCSEDQNIRLWNAKTDYASRSMQNRLDQTHGPRAIAFSPTGDLLASGGEDQTVRLWNTHTGLCTTILRGHTNWVRAVTFSPDSTLLASSGEDHTIRLWHIRPADQTNPTTSKLLQGHTSWVRTLAFSPDGRLLASGSDDHTIRLWHLASPDNPQILHNHTNRVRAVVFSPDGHMLASGSEDQTICLWQVDTGQIIRTLTGHQDRILSVAFSPDGHLLASGSDDGYIRLWHVASGNCQATIPAHTNRVRSITFNINNHLFASSSDDGTIKLWNAQTGAALKTLICAKPYERMNVTNVKGLTNVQKITLRLLGAIDEDLPDTPQ